jgi:hypothetical protein
VPAHDLLELLKRLHGEAVKVLVGSGGSEARSRREDAETDRRFQLGYETCERVGPVNSRDESPGGCWRSGWSTIIRPDAGALDCDRDVCRPEMSSVWK